MNWIEEQVYLTVGRASMCWDDFPQSQYNDVYAHKVADELIRAIYSYFSEEKKQQLQMRPERVNHFEEVNGD